MLNCFALLGQQQDDSFRKSCETIIARITEDNISLVNNVSVLNDEVSGYITEITDEGAFPDVVYTDKARTNWNSVIHLERVCQMALSYIIPKGKLYQSQELYDKIVIALEYWDKCRPKSDNWWYNQVSAPRYMGKILVLLRAGKNKLPVNLENSLLLHLKQTGGNPADANRTGANKADIALHWLYRGCLQLDRDVVEIAMREAFSPSAYTTEEGIQFDNSYFQHNQQLYIGGYASVLINRIIDIAWYTLGSDYQLSGQQLNILSRFVRETFLRCIRGKYMCYNVMGRGVSRKGALKQTGSVDWLKKLKVIDKEYAGEYEKAIVSLSGSEEGLENIQQSFTHYYVGDFSLYKNQNYSFGVRTVSERTYRSEEGNGENLKGYFISDGSTMISVAGNEYEDIFPVWDWCKVPGVTNPQVSKLPRMEKTWTHFGESDFVGGVSDGSIGVSAYKMNNKSDGVDISANKSWFFFGEEVVCLGSNISTATDCLVMTTLNQCLLSGNVYSSQNGKTRILAKGERLLDVSLDWILHNNVGYFFPERQVVSLEAEHKTGNWYSINTSQSKDMVHKDVFCTWINHGIAPHKATYSYVIVPHVFDIAQMRKYKLSDLKIIENSDSIQAVRDMKSRVTQIVFYQNGKINIGKIEVSVDKGCVMMLREEGKLLTLFVSDPSHKLNTLNIRIQSRRQIGRLLVDFSKDGHYKGKTHQLQCSIEFS